MNGVDIVPLTLLSKPVRIWGLGLIQPPQPVEKDASMYYVSILSTYLSIPYELPSGCKVEGEVIEVKHRGQVLPELKGKRVTLLLYRLVNLDNLFFSKEIGYEFRDYGLIEPFEISLKLEKAIIDTKEITIYPKRDITV